MKKYFRISSNEARQISRKFDTERNFKFLYFSVAAFCLILCLDIAPERFTYLFLLPLSLTLFSLFLPPISRYGAGYVILLFITYLRFAVMPVLKRFSYSAIYPLWAYETAIFLSALECALWCASIILADNIISLLKSRRFPSINDKFRREDWDNKGIIKSSVSACFFGFSADEPDFSPCLLLLFPVVTLLTAIFYPRAVASFSLVFTLKSGHASGGGAAVAFLSLIKPLFCITAAVYCLFRYKKASRAEGFGCYFLTILLFLFNAFVNNNLGRNEILLSSIVLLQVLCGFKRYRFFTACGCFLAVVCVLVYATVSRFDAISVESALNAYFQGVDNVACGVLTLEYPFYARTFLKDFFANTFVLAGKLINDVSFTQLFNLTFYGHGEWYDQIPPAFVQAIYDFSFFAPFFLLLIAFVVLRCDRLLRESSRPAYALILYYFGVRTAFFSCGNMTILVTFLFNFLLPSLFVLELFSRREFAHTPCKTP